MSDGGTTNEAISFSSWASCASLSTVILRFLVTVLVTVLMIGSGLCFDFWSFLFIMLLSLSICDAASDSDVPMVVLIPSLDDVALPLPPSGASCE